MTHSENQTVFSGTRFFGRVSASIAHDLRNVIAVISENAGLLEDLCLMAAKGPPLDPARLKRVAGSIRDQVRRGDRILTTMSRFAHSVDAAFAEIDAAELVEILMALSTRMAAMQGVAVQAAAAAGPVMIKTSPFVMLNLLWRCLEYSLSVAGPGKSVVLSVEKSGGETRFRFSSLESLPQAAAGEFPAPEDEGLSQTIDARVQIDPRAGALTVLVAAP
jgi:signal transduction histidine kinase